MSYFYLMLAIPFLFCLIIPFLYKKLNEKIHTGWFVIFVPIIVFSYLLSYIPSLVNGQKFYKVLKWIPTYNINLTMNIDGLSLFFGLIISGIGILVILYSVYYMAKDKEELHNFYIYILLFMGSMLGLVFSDNLFVLYVFWEMTSISSFLLIAYWFERDKSRAGARKSMVITISGGLAMLAGFIMLSMITGSNNISEMVSMVSEIKQHALFLPAMFLILLGAFTKSAQYPFSIWLPDAMEAPTPVSAFLHSATMVKAGIYLVARLTFIFAGSAEWFWSVTAVGLITLLYGSVNAVKQTDLKALLAYSTISQLGLIMSLLGLGSAALYFEIDNGGALYALAIFVAMFHLLNHATFKGSLFMVIGIIDHEVGTRDIRKLGGLLPFMPVSFTLAMIGSFAMAGLPFFNGFLSKELFFTALLNAKDMVAFRMETWGIVFVAVAWIASVFTFVYCMTMLFKTFTGKARNMEIVENAHEAPVGMLIAPVILASFVIGIFIFPNFFVTNLLQPVWEAILPTYVESSVLQVQVAAWHGFNTELFMTIGLIVAGILLYRTIHKWYVVYRHYPQQIMLNNLYDLVFELLESISLIITKRYMTNQLRDYLVYIFAFIIIVVGGALIYFDGITISLFANSSVEFYEIILLLAAVLTAILALKANTRMTAIIAVSGLGFLVMFMFVLFRAPDLALTQLVVETVTTVLFLLCFKFLPQLAPERSSKKTKIANGIIAAGVGIVVTLLALSANSMKSFPSISRFYERAYELAGGKNIVNVILVDFRGFDTMLEIVVLSIAGLGVYTLIKLRMQRGKQHETTK